MEEEQWQPFEKIKQVLAELLVLVPPILGKPLKLYISIVEEFIECLLEQDAEGGIERTIYYLPIVA